MRAAWLQQSALGVRRGRVGVALIAVGEALIIARLRPISDFYFPVVWLGYILLLDATSEAHSGRSLWACSPRVFLVMFPMSAVFWWIFELFNNVVQNWVYIGGGAYQGVSFVAIASVDFSTVLPAVWCTALLVDQLLPFHWLRGGGDEAVPRTVLWLELSAGIGSVLITLAFPRYAFALIWGCTCLILDPINAMWGRPSMIGEVWRANWRLPACFSLGALACGFFWETWNYWSMPKWIYHVPYVGWFHVFEMPILGYLGYLTFGLELFAMAQFVLPALRLHAPDVPSETRAFPDNVVRDAAS